MLRTTFNVMHACMCVGPDDEVPLGLTLALFEVIHYDGALADAGVMAGAERALLHMGRSHDFQLAESGHPPGLYRMLAHPSAGLRAMVGVLAFTISSTLPARRPCLHDACVLHLPERTSSLAAGR